MRHLTLLMCVVATPAFAHHSIAVTASLLPLILGLAAISAGGLTAYLNSTRKKQRTE